MAAGQYSAGSVFLEVVPSFDKWHSRVQAGLRQQATRSGREAGEAFDDGFDAATEGDAARRALGDTRTVEREATRAGERSGRGFAGAFRNNVDRVLKQSMANLGKGINDETDDLVARLQQLRDVEIGVDMDAGQAITQLALLSVVAGQLADSDVDIEVEYNADQVYRGIRRTLTELGALQDVEVAVRPEVNLSPARARLAELKAELERLKFEIVIGLDDAQTQRRLQEIYAEVQTLDATDVDITVDLDALAFRAQLAQLERQTQVRIDANLTPAQTRLRELSGEISRLSARIGIDVDANTSMATIRRIRDEIRDLQAQIEILDGQGIDINVDVDALRARAQLAALERQLRTSHNANIDTANSFRSFSGVLLGVAALGPLVVPAMAAVAGAIAGIAPAAVGAASGLGVLALGLSGIGTAVGAMNDVAKNAQRDGLAAAKTMRTATNSVRNAEQGLARARTAAGRAGVDAAARVANAQQGLADAQEQATERVAAAQRELAQAQRQAAEQIEAALQRQERAERSLERAQRSAQKAQEDLTEARRDAARDIEDLELALRRGENTERTLTLDLQETRFSQAIVDEDPQSSATEREAAALATERARIALEEVRIENGRLREEQATQRREGIEGSEVVQDAQERLRDSLQGQKDAEREVGDAARDVAQTRVDAAEAVARAQAGIDDAVRQGARGVADALAQVDEASAANAQAQIDAADGVAAAQQSLRDAQEGYAEALIATGDLGSASMQKLNESMRNLGPAGQAFAAFIFSLKDEFFALRNAAQEGFLPGLTTAISNIMTAGGPGLLAFVREMGFVLGDLAIRASEALTSPVWMDFFTMMAQYAPAFTEQWAMIGGQLLTIFGQLLTAFAPFSAQFNEAIIAILDSFSAFLASDAGQSALTDFIAYLSSVGPEVWEFIGALASALLNLAVALAPYAEDLLRFLTGILDWVAGLDPAAMNVVAVAIIALVVGFQAMFGIISLFTSIGIVSTAIAALQGLIVFGTTTAASLLAVGAAIVGFLVVVAAGVYLLYQRSETFRNLLSAIGEVVGEVWDGIKSAVVEAYEQHIKPALQGLVGEWDGIRVGLQRMWMVAKPILLLLAGAVGLVLATIVALGAGIVNGVLTAIGPLIAGIARVFGGIIQVIGGVIEVIRGLLLGDLGVVKDGVIAIFQGLWDVVAGIVGGFIGTVLGFIGGFVEGFVQFFQWLYDKLVGHSIIPDLVRDILGWIVKLRDDAVAWVKNLIDWVIAHFTAMGVATVRKTREIRDDVVGFFSSLRDGALDLIQRMKDGIADRINALPAVFASAVALIGQAWDGLRELAKAPVRFVVNTVINEGLIDAFNGIVGTLGLGDGLKIDHLRLPDGFATGGWTGPGSRLEPAGVVHRDEFVVQKSSRRRFEAEHPGWLDYLNATGKLPGYAEGGLVAFGRLLQSKGFRVGEHPAFGNGRVGRHSPGSLHYSGNAIDVNWGPGGESAEEKRAIDGIVGLAKDYGLRTIWRVKDHFNHAHFDTGRSGNMIGRLGDAAGAVWDAVTSPLDTLRGAVSGLLGQIPGKDGKFGQMLTGMVGKFTSAIGDKVSSMTEGLGDFISGSTGPIPGNDVGAVGVRQAVQTVAQGFGWGEGAEWNAIQWLVNKESSWKPNAQNPNSTAYGLFQFLNSTWKGTGFNKTSDPAQQTAAGLRYIKDRYGTPSAAVDFHRRNNWYDSGGRVTPVDLYDTGGIVPPGLSGVLNMTGDNEHMAVFTQSQWAALEGLANRGNDRPAPSFAEHATFYSYDPKDIMAEFRREQSDAAALADLGSVVGGVSF